MLRSTLLRAAVGLVAVLLTATACSDSTGPDGDRVATVTILTAAPSVTIGGTVQLAAATLSASGATLSGKAIAWSTLDPNIATVSPAGLVTGVGAGTVGIRATHAEFSATTTVTVAAPLCGPTTTVGTVASAATLTGQLSPADCLLFEAYRADGRTLTIAAPTTLQIDLMSPQFDAFVYVTDLQMNGVGGDDDGSGTNDARLVLSLAPGSYIVWASSLDQGAAGSYTLTTTPVLGCSAATTNGPMPTNQPVAGALTGDDCILPIPFAGDGWTLSLSTETVLQFTMQGVNMAPAVVVTTAALQPIAVGDAGFNGTATILQSFPAGEYLVWATSFVGTYGSYTLTMAPSALPSCTDIDGTLVLGQAVSAALATDDCLQGGRRRDFWRLDLPATTNVSVGMSSGDFDTLLEIRDSTGATIAVNDDFGGTTNSRITISLPAGSYTVVAMSYYSGDLGAYALTATTVPSSVMAAVPSAADGDAARRKGARRLDWSQLDRR